MLNARIRKAYIKNKTKVYSVGNPGDLTYPYEYIGSDSGIIQDIVLGKHNISKELLNSKKPLIIIGNSALNSKAGHYIFEALKNFLTSNNLIRSDWNSLNILNQQASRVGAIDLGAYLTSQTPGGPSHSTRPLWAGTALLGSLLAS